jgi:putative dehydrogenase
MNQRSAGRSVGVVGLGIMGSSIAANLQKGGFQVHGVEVHASTRRRMAPLLSSVSAQVGDLVTAGVQHIVTSLPSSAALMAVCQALVQARLQQTGRQRRLVLAEASTFSLKDKQAARELLAQADIEMIDAPLSGTGAQARTKDLTVYASGDAKAIQSMMPVFKGFSRAQFSVGEFGNGMKMKLVANLLVAIHNVSAAEAILFGKKLGLAPQKVVDVVADGAGGSRMFQVRGPMMATRTWQQATMKNEVWQKDMTLIHDALHELSLPAPLFAACIPIYHAAMSQGHQLHDTAAVYAVLEKFAGEA